MLFLTTLTTPAYGAKKKTCYDTAQTQYELNVCAASELKKADYELNRVYKEILKRYAGDRVFISRLKEAQRAWVSFRDAELEAIFPAAEKQF
ncbi:MAG TPA: lysozyme inhibitor LprI family protein [Geobacteraceae bacterium]|nr:lysozyme inhibitor LprI family protein [Geobacteraceae bacterium]